LGLITNGGYVIKKLLMCSSKGMTELNERGKYSKEENKHIWKRKGVK
jgi:hypothetical protein